jgi:hypothetical protein
MIIDENEYANFVVEYIVPASRSFFMPENETTKDELYLKEMYDIEDIAATQLKVLSAWIEIFENAISSFDSGSISLDGKIILYYHYQSYLTGIASYQDYIMRLANHVCQLGIPNRKISFELINGNKIWIGNDLINTIKKLDFFCQKFRAIRNQSIHQGNSEFDTIDKISLFMINPSLDKHIIYPKKIKQFVFENRIKYLETLKVEVLKTNAELEKFHEQIINLIPNIAKVEIEVIKRRNS